MDRFKHKSSNISITFTGALRHYFVLILHTSPLIRLSLYLVAWLCCVVAGRGDAMR